MSKVGPKNYIMEVKSLNEKWIKEWCIRKSNNGKSTLLTNLGEAVDIIYFNDIQTVLP